MDKNEKPKRQRRQKQKQQSVVKKTETIVRMDNREKRKRKKKNKPTMGSEIVVRPGQNPEKGRSLTVPFSNESCSNGNIINQYTECLVSPMTTMSRYPDGDLRHTGLFRTVEVYEVPAFYAAGNKTGRFSACLRPIMGNSSVPNQFHAGIADAALGDDWKSIDWSLPSSYSLNNGGFNPRIDKNKPFLTAGQSGYYYQQSNSELGGPQTAPVIGTNLWGPGMNENTLGSNNSGINVRYEVGSNNGLVIPYGTYALSLCQSYISAVAGPITVGFTLIDSTVTRYFDESPIGSALANQVTMTGIGSDDQCYYNVVINSAPGANILRVKTWLGTSATTLPAGTLTSIETELCLTPTTMEGRFSGNTSGGVIEEIRPIAQSVLCTYMGTDFENGGMIAVHYAQPDLIDSNYYQNAGDQRGQLQIYENLAAIPGAYDGRTAKGAYAWWSPFTQTDEAFRSVSAANAYRLPGIVVSGTHVVNEMPTVDGSEKVMRLEVATVYEYTTASSAFELKQLRGSDLIIDRCDNALSAQPHVMENESHLEFIRRLSKKLLSFALANKDVIVKIGALAVSVL